MRKKIKKSTIKLLCVELFLSLAFLLNVFVININNTYIIISFLLVNILIVIYLLGYEKNRQRLRKDALLNALIFSSLLQIFMYLSGLLFGFLKNGYNMQLTGILRNILPALLLIIATEKLRYCINQKGRESRLVLIFSCITFIIIDSTISAMAYNFGDKKVIIELVCVSILPSITKNIFLTYNTTKFGYSSSIIYRAILELPIYIIPILPNINDYLRSIIYFLYPILVLMVTKNSIGKINPNKEVVYKKANRIPLIIAIIFITIIIVLNSGVAPFYIIAIGSGSMEKTLYRGDAVIIKKINKKEVYNLKKGDILVYNYQNKTVIHRIYTIDLKDGNIQIITKGDNNELPDSWVVGSEQIQGKVIIPIKYVGYPTIWLNDVLS